MRNYNNISDHNLYKLENFIEMINYLIQKLLVVLVIISKCRLIFSFIKFGMFIENYFPFIQFI